MQWDMPCPHSLLGAGGGLPLGRETGRAVVEGQDPAARSQEVGAQGEGGTWAEAEPRPRRGNPGAKGSPAATLAGRRRAGSAPSLYHLRGAFTVNKRAN